MRKKPIFWYFVVVIVLAIMGALVPWFGDEPLVTKIMWTIWAAIMGVLGYAFIQTNKDIFYGGLTVMEKFELQDWFRKNPEQTSNPNAVKEFLKQKKK